MKWPKSANRKAGAPPFVGEGRRPVGFHRHSAWLALAALLLVSACAPNPEQRLVGRWRESNWRYEKLGTFELGSLPSERDDPALPALLRHEAEHWEFHPDGSLVMRGAGGAQRVARWKLKGRGHLLLLDGARPNEHEAYEIKELNDGRLVLHYDIGLEVRGIARLTFTKVDGGNSAGLTAAASQPGSAN